MNRNGGSSFVAYVIGEAFLYVSAFSARVPLRKGMRNVSSVDFSQGTVKSVGPKKLTTACSRLDCSGLPPLPSRPSFLSLVPSRQARCPPAEKPMAPMRSGLILYFLA